MVCDVYDVNHCDEMAMMIAKLLKIISFFWKTTQVD